MEGQIGPMLLSSSERGWDLQEGHVPESDLSEFASEYHSAKLSRGRLLARTEAFEIRKLPDAAGAVVLKRARNPSHDSLQSLRNQFEALQDIDQKTQGSLRDSVPIPLALRGDTLIMTP